MSRRAIPIEPHIDKLVQAVLLGATLERAAEYAGISKKTFLRWRQQAEMAKDGTPLAALRERLSAAEGQLAVRCLMQIEQAANAGDWRAAAWKLERRFPRDYGRLVQEHTGQDGAPIVVKVEYAAGLSGLLREAQALLPDDGTLPNSSRG